MLEDHALHVYVLGGPDFIVGPDAPKELRNVVGVIGKLGVDTGKRVISMRRRLREFIAYVGGKVDPPGAGPSRRSRQGHRRRRSGTFSGSGATTAWSSRGSRLQVFKDIVLANQDYVEADHLRRLHASAPTTWGWWTRRTTSISTTARSAW